MDSIPDGFDSDGFGSVAVDPRVRFLLGSNTLNSMSSGLSLLSWIPLASIPLNLIPSGLIVWVRARLLSGSNNLGSIPLGLHSFEFDS